MTTGTRAVETRSGRRAQLLRWLAPIALVLLSAVFVLGQVGQQRAFSPIDEYVYFDYVAKVPTQGYVRSGEEVGEIARNELSCRGVIGYGHMGEQCDVGSHEDDAAYPYNGETGADIYSPLYFWATWAAAQPATWFGVDLLDAARGVGVLWLSLTLLATFAALREMGAPRLLSTGLATAMLALPIAEWSFAYVSTDGAALASAAVLALAVVKVWRGRWSPWWFAVIAAVATLLKLQTVAVVGAGAIALVLAAIVERDRRNPWTLVVPAVVAGVGSLATQVVWVLVRSATAVDERPDIGDGQPGYSLEAVLSLAVRPLLNLGRVDSAEGLLSKLAIFAVVAVGLGAIVSACFVRPAGEPLRFGLGIGAATVGLLMGPLLAWLTYLMTDAFVPTPSRYAAPLIPLLLVTAVPLLHQHAAAARVVGVAGLLLGVLGTAAAIVQ
ncbi:hypothetical protein [Agrococcus sp. HG114]|uniref:hypothetical protein n=1 Tax=Agrococcus sp. HG114 TaxID=2969757 RepID=UPI00215AA3DD|nr:hypothetical protein [Agrococcus sp. HG114]MCR8670423.1 hypothetical protein [Agrococcus sp. HG114]